MNASMRIGTARSTPPTNGRVEPGGDGYAMPIPLTKSATPIPNTTPTKAPVRPINSASVTSSAMMVRLRNPRARSVASSTLRSTIEQFRWYCRFREPRLQQ